LPKKVGLKIVQLKLIITLYQQKFLFRI